MKKAPAPTKTQGAFQDHTQHGDSTKSAHFLGTDNPRHLRVITVMKRRPLCRSELDNIAGCANGPDLIAALRALGLSIPCERVKFIDRDGKPCRPGDYSFITADRRKVYACMRTLSKGGAV
jgi:hypothetical protein